MALDIFIKKVCLFFYLTSISSLIKTTILATFLAIRVTQIPTILLTMFDLPRFPRFPLHCFRC